MNGINTMFRVPVLDQEIINCFWHFCGTVKPADHNNKCVSLAFLEFSNVANIERLIRSLAFNKHIVTNFVFNIIIITSVSEIFSFVILPSFAIGMFLSAYNGLSDIFFINITWNWAAVLQQTYLISV